MHLKPHKVIENKMVKSCFRTRQTNLKVTLWEIKLKIFIQRYCSGTSFIVLYYSSTWQLSLSTICLRYITAETSILGQFLLISTSVCKVFQDSVITTVMSSVSRSRLLCRSQAAYCVGLQYLLVTRLFPHARVPDFALIVSGTSVASVPVLISSKYQL